MSNLPTATGRKAVAGRLASVAPKALANRLKRDHETSAAESNDEFVWSWIDRAMNGLVRIDRVVRLDQWADRRSEICRPYLVGSIRTATTC
jgi:hypothetical protein